MNKKKIWLLALILSIGLGIRAQNVLTISSEEGAPGAEVNVSIALQNNAPITSIQLAIPLNEELALVDGSAVVGSRCEGHSITVGVKDGILNVLVFSLSMQPIAAGNGEVASLHLRLGNLPKSIALEPQKIVLTDETGTAVSASAQSGTVTIRAAKAQFSTMEVDFGEVPIYSIYTRTMTVANVGNDDLIITDLEFSDMNVYSTTTELPLIVSPGSTHTLNVTYAPVERGVSARTMKVVCNSTSKLNTIQLKAKPFAVNELHMQPAAGNSDEEVTLGMTMNNMDDISGYQVEFQLPSALEYVDGSFTLSNRKQDHTSIVSMTGGVLRIIVFSNNDKPLIGNDGEIGSFRVKLMGRNSVQLKPTKTVLSATINGHVENVTSDVFGAQVTISSPRIATDNRLDFGDVAVTEPCEKSFNIHNQGSAPMTVSRILFNNENLTVKETLPLSIEAGHTGQITVVYGSMEETNFEATMKIYSNDPDQRLHDVQIVGSRFAPNYFSVSTPDVYTDGILGICVSLNTYDQIDAMQFDVEFPPQYELSDENYTLESRAQAMTVTSRQIGSQTLRYFCYSLSGGCIAAGDGHVMTLQFQPVGGSAVEGNYTVQVKNIKLGTSDMTDKYAGANVQSTFNVKKHNPVTITANSYTRTYGEENPEFGFTYEGATVIGTPDISCEATVTSPVGEYPIVILKGSVTNEEDTYVNGVLTITKAPLTVTATNYSIVYGSTLPTYEATYSGFKNSDNASVLTTQPSFSCMATSSSAVGQYDIIVSGATSQNYDINYVKGVLTINAKIASELTISDIAAVTYNGSAQTPAVTVKDGTKILISGIDYTVSYSNNTNVGTATVTVTGKGNYTGTKTATFIINDSIIIFTDANVKAICIANWDKNGDNELGMTEAAAVTDIGTIFQNRTNITSFDELQYFTSLTSIDNNAFNCCGKLSSVTIPNSVTSIGFAAFNQCTSLTAITIPQSVTNIDSVPFCNCTNLSSITVALENTVYDSRNNCNAIIETNTNKLVVACANSSIPSDVELIGSNAFSYLSLNSVNIPNSVTSIERCAFLQCEITSLSIGSGVTSIEEEAFENSVCSSIVVVSGNSVYDSRNNCNAIIETGTNALIKGSNNSTIPNNVTSIGESAFYGCNGLISVEIPNSVTTIGDHAFFGTGWYNNQADGLLYLSNWLLGYKESKPSGAMDISEGTMGIANYAFSECSGLTSVTIPQSVTSIGSYAFSGCSGLTKVKGEWTTPPSIISNVFYNVNTNNAILYVPKDCSASYFGADVWEDYKAIKEFPDSDVNQDGETDVVDVVDIARFVVAIPSVSFEEFLADMNGDRSVNVADAIVLVNEIAGDMQFAKPALAPRKTASDILTLFGDGSNLSLQMEGTSEYAAFQFDLWLPSDMNMMRVSLNDARRQGHQLLYNKVGDGHYRVVALSTSGNVFNGTSGELLCMTLDNFVTDDVRIDNIHFVTARGIDVPFESLGISYIIKGITTGISSSQTNEGYTLPVYNLNGQRLTIPRKGLNIIGGKKILVK